MSASNFHIQMDDESIRLIQKHLDDAADTFMDELTEEVEWAWRRLAAAESSLKSTKSIYLKAIDVKRDGFSIDLSLTDELASSLENGQESYDLKPGFLQNRKFRVIPLVDSGTDNVTRFRTVTPNSAGWKHPGLHPRKLTEKVLAEMENNLAGEVLERVMSRSKL